MHRKQWTASRPGAPARRRGFTMVEALITVSVIGIVAAFALPHYDTLPSRADGAMRMVRGALSLAQRMAIQHQHDMVVSFDVSRQRVRIAEDSTDDGHVGAGERERWESLEADARLIAPPAAVPGYPAGVGIAGPGVRMIDGLPSVVFRRDGAASGDVVVYVGATRGARSEHRAVTVLHTTGRTEWWRYARSAWTEGDL